jgi:hypothetical protein
MAIATYTNGYVLVNGVDLTDHVSKVTVDDKREQKDITTVNATTNNIYTKGLGDATITLTFFQDWAAAKVHATLQPLLGSTTPIAVEVRPTNAARSATNPAALLAGALLFEYNFLDAQAGEVPPVTAVFVNAVAAGLTYPTS